MIGKILNTTTRDTLKKGMEGTAFRHRAIAQNIANIDTPGYKRKFVTFEDSMRAALNSEPNKLARTHEKHLPMGGGSMAGVVPKIHVDRSSSLRVDGNNVDVDREMALLAKNTSNFLVMTELLARNYSSLKQAMKSPI